MGGRVLAVSCGKRGLWNELGGDQWNWRYWCGLWFSVYVDVEIHTDVYLCVCLCVCVYTQIYTYIFPVSVRCEGLRAVIF